MLEIELNQKYLKSLLELRNSCTDLYLFGFMNMIESLVLTMIQIQYDTLQLSTEQLVIDIAPVKSWTQLQLLCSRSVFAESERKAGRMWRQFIKGIIPFSFLLLSNNNFLIIHYIPPHHLIWNFIKCLSCQDGHTALSSQMSDVVFSIYYTIYFPLIFI